MKYPNKFIFADTKDIPPMSEQKLAPDVDSMKVLMETGRCFITNPQECYTVEADLSRHIKVVHEYSPGGSQTGASTGFVLFGTSLTPDTAIEKAGFHFQREEIDEKFGKLWVFEGILPHSSKIKYTFKLAPDFGYLVTQCFYGATQGRRKSQKVLSISKLDGLFIPKASKELFYLEYSDDQYPDKISTYYFTHQSLNDVPDSLMQVTLSKGDEGYNLITRRGYSYGKNSEKLPIYLNLKQDNKKMFFGWLYIASVTSLLLVTVGAFIKWKRKQLSKQG